MKYEILALVKHDMLKSGIISAIPDDCFVEYDVEEGKICICLVGTVSGTIYL